MSFADLGVPANLAGILAERGITVPTPIQQVTLPDSLAGRDVLGRGRTGSGKTYAFLLPVVARLAQSRRTTRPGSPRALILAPTRELVGQIEQALKPLATAAGLTTMTIFGGVSQVPQVNNLRRGADIVLACPGRLEDLIKQRHCSLGDIEVTVLDEADHMADLGFLPAVRRILEQTPRTGQRLLFSATLDAAIDTLVKRFLNQPVTHQADSAQSPVSAMDHHVLHVDRAHRVQVLVDLTSAPGRTMVFTRTKHGAKALARQLNASGVPAVEMHGNLSQGARTRNMEAFHAGRRPRMVATDIAARGIHVDDVALVVHADPPIEHKAYLHRSGRTARAGAAGTVITLMTDEQVRDVRALTRAAGIRPTMTRVMGAAHPVLARAGPGRAHAGRRWPRAPGPRAAVLAARWRRLRSPGPPALRRVRQRRRRWRAQAPRRASPSRARPPQGGDTWGKRSGGGGGRRGGARRGAPTGSGGGRSHSAAGFSSRSR